MLFFYFSSGEGPRWYIGPLIMLAPLVLNLLPAVAEELYSLLFTPFLEMLSAPSSFSLAYMLVLAVANVVIPALGVVAMYRSFRWVQHNGGPRFLLRLLLQGAQGQGQAHGAQRPAGGAGHPAGPARRRVTVEQVAEALGRLPTETYMSPEQLATLHVHELKERIRARGLTPVQCIEKGDLVQQLLEHGGSSASSCSICCEDYGAAAAAAGPTAAHAGPTAGEGRGDAAGTEADEAGSGSRGGCGSEEGEVLRVLRCGHRFHVECVDKWFLSAADYTREPACPLCNAPLLAGSGATGTGTGVAAGR